MIFVKFTYNDDRVFGFCLDDVTIFESDDDNTKILLSDGREEILDIQIDDFCAKVFSDENQTKEYNLVEIASDRPRVVAGTGSLFD